VAATFSSYGSGKRIKKGLKEFVLEEKIGMKAYKYS
jgi:hypothetical protein